MEADVEYSDGKTMMVYQGSYVDKHGFLFRCGQMVIGVELAKAPMYDLLFLMTMKPE